MARYEMETTIAFGRREAVTLNDVRGAILRVTRGSVWITQDHDTQDIVLRAGDSWVVERDGATVLEAQGKATVQVVGCALPEALRSRQRRPVMDLLARLWNPWIAGARPVPYY